MLYKSRGSQTIKCYRHDNIGEAARYPFYIVSYGLFECQKGFVTLRDSRKDFQLLHTLSGEGYLIVDKIRVSLKPGSYTLIDCDKLHEYGTQGDKWTYEYLHFMGSGMRPYRKWLVSGPFVLFPKDAMLLEVYFKKLENYYERSDVIYAQECAGIAVILSAIASARGSAPEGGKAIGHKTDMIEPAVHYIYLHYAEKLTLDDLLSVTYLSKYYFCRRFKAITGYSPHQYITKVRMESAKRLLTTSSLPVADVGRLTGFPQSVTFIRQFESYTGKTPSEYRKDNASENVSDA